MTSPRKIEANRRNARASTGPKTGDGKARSARNARRHGLAVPIQSEPQAAEGIATLARELVGDNPTLQQREAATRVAEAQLDIARIRRARATFISPVVLDGVKLVSLNSADKKPDWQIGDESQAAQKLVGSLAKLGKTSKALDRYERRALSRRKFAIRDFDDAKDTS
jgi:hypothetical protein